MFRAASLMLAISAMFLAALPGCNSGQRQWEITVENKSDARCSFFIALDSGNGNVKVEDVAKSKPLTLIVGENKTVVESVRVVRGKDEQTLTPKVELPVGKRYAIVVAADGEVEGSVSDR